MYRLNTQAAFGRFEISLLGLVTAVGRQIADRVNTCFTGVALRNAVAAYAARFRENPQAAQDAAVPGVPQNQDVEMQNMC